MIFPPKNYKYSISHIQPDTYLIEVYRTAGERWYSVKHTVCESEEEVRQWLNHCFRLVSSSELPSLYSSDVLS